MPRFLIATGDLAGPDSPVAAVAAELDATPSQVAPAWLLQKSPVILPIPGTTSVEHPTDNMGAARLTPATTWRSWTPRALRAGGGSRTRTPEGTRS